MGSKIKLLSSAPTSPDTISTSPDASSSAVWDSSGTTNYEAAASYTISKTLTAGTWYYCWTINANNGWSVRMAAAKNQGSCVLYLLGKLTITQNTGVGSITVTRTSSPNAGASTGTLSNGATVYSGDVLSWSASPATGYQMSTTSGTVTVSGNTTIAPTATYATSSISATSCNIGANSTITISKQNSSLTDTVTWSCGSASGTIATKSTATSFTWTVPTSLLSQLSSTSKSTTVTLTTQTYTGDTSLGTNTCTITITGTADQLAPALSVSNSDPNGYLSTYGKYVKSKSALTVTASVTYKYSATVSSIAITANGKSQTSTSATFASGVITSANNTSITVKVTDSRGFTASYSGTIEIYDYSAPTLSGLSAFRCDESGTAADQGQYFSLTATGNITSLDGQNVMTLTYKVDDSTATALTSGETTVVGTYSYLATYTVTFTVTDSFGESLSSSIVIPTAKYVVHINAEGTGMGIFKAAEEAGAVQVDGYVEVTTPDASEDSEKVATTEWVRTALLNMIYPVGSIYMSVNSTSPASFLGGTWQRIQDRFLLAAGSTYTAGATGGSSSRTLTVDNMPAHTHSRGTMEITGNMPTRTFYISSPETIASSFVTDWPAVGSSDDTDRGAFSITSELFPGNHDGIQGLYNTPSSSTYTKYQLNFKASDSWTGETSSAGSGSSFSCMPPYIAVYIWQRTA